MNKTYEQIIEKILDEVDEDIKEQMLKTYHSSDGLIFPTYYLLQDPANTILGWQALRDRKKTNE